MASLRSSIAQLRGCIAKLRDDEEVPLICPTCQNVFVGMASMPAPLSFQGVAFFAWGCFRDFMFRALRYATPGAFSGEVDTGSREENASNKSWSRVPIPSERKRL
jgi:hypothetical protein